MSCRPNYDPCLDSKLNQIGSYASVARQSAQSSAVSATSAANSATEANNYLTQVTNIYNDFSEKYLGSFDTAPLPPIQEGALYWNSVSNTLFVWNGSSWSAIDDDEIYLGGFATEPMLNNQGLPLVSGNLYWNSVTNNLWAYDGSDWIVTTSNMPTGGGTNRVFYLNDNQVTANYTIPLGQNAMSAGPVTVVLPAVVTIPPGTNWTIV